MPLTDEQYRRSAARVSREPEFLGHRIQAVLAAERVTDAELAARFGCTLRQLDQLSLCLVPRQDRFDVDCEQIAEHVGIGTEHVRFLSTRV